MQASDDVKLGDRLIVSRGRRFERLLKRHCVGPRRIFLAAEGAEAARRDAHIRGINMAINVEVGLVAMHALADVVSHPAHSEYIAGAVERKRVGGIKAVAGHQFGMNRLQPGVVSLKRVVLARDKHPFDDIAGARRKSQKQGVNALQ